MTHSIVYLIEVGHVLSRILQWPTGTGGVSEDPIGEYDVFTGNSFGLKCLRSRREKKIEKSKV